MRTVPEGHLQRTRWSGFHVGKRYKGEAKPSLNSRCYLQFGTLEHAEEFIKDYHGHQFVDSQGESFRAVACFAPYQKVPRQKAQKDPRDGTIGDDLAYKEFVEKLSAKSSYEAPPNPVTLLKPADYGDTPLLNYLKNRSKERRARIEKKDKKRWRDGGPGGLEPVAEEDPKRAKWRCAECGTSKHLEEDPDDRGTFYCTYCWESWENQPSTSKVKKKKKKHIDEGEDEGREETERSKRKKQDKERDGTAESSSHKAEWRAKDTREGKVPSTSRYGDEDDRDRRHKKKKKSAEDEAVDDAADAGGHAAQNRWRVKSAAEETGEWERDRHRSRRGTHKDTRDDWWAEPTEEQTAKHSNRRSERPERGDKVDDGRGATRWRAKAPATAAEDGGEHEEKPGRSRKEKAHADESSDYWVPKFREAS